MFAFKPLAGVLMALACAAAAQAAPVQLGLVDVAGIAPVNVNVPFSGPFSQDFNFSLASGNGVQVGLSSIFWGASAADLPVFSFTLSGGSGAGTFQPAVTLSPDLLSVSAGSWLSGLQAGPSYTLTISGSEANNLHSYYTLQLAAANVAVVPEPATPALLLAGLGVVGMIVRRRKEVR